MSNISLAKFFPLESIDKVYVSAVKCDTMYLLSLFFLVNPLYGYYFIFQAFYLPGTCLKNPVLIVSIGICCIVVTFVAFPF